MQLGIDAACRLELEAAGAGPGDGRALDAVARQQVAGAPGPVNGLRYRLAPLVPAAQVLGRAVIGLQPGKGEVRRLGDPLGEIVDIFTMPDMALKGTITGFNQPQGECSDNHGNIYVADTQATQVEEYSRTGTLLNTYPDKSGYPVGCAVNPLNGDLAVANISGFSTLGHVLVFTSPSSRPSMVINPAQVSYFFLGYDIHGDLWVDGRDRQKNYIVSACGGFVCHTINLSGGKIYFPGAVQWDQKEYSWVLFDQRCGNTTAACSYWVSGSGVLGQATNYQNYSGGAVCDMIQGVVAAYGKRYTAGTDYEYIGCPNAGNSSVNRWKYPAGGAPTNYATELVTQQPAGAAISTQNVTTPPQ